MSSVHRSVHIEGENDHGVFVANGMKKKPITDEERFRAIKKIIAINKANKEGDRREIALAKFLSEKKKKRQCSYVKNDGRTCFNSAVECPRSEFCSECNQLAKKKAERRINASFREAEKTLIELKKQPSEDITARKLELLGTLFKQVEKLQAL